jgi:hypothetical protein
VAEALPVILEDLSADRLFTALHRQGRLRDVLAAVPVSVLSGIVVSPGDDDLAGLWPLLVAVVRIADVWALWTSTPLDVVDVAEGYRARPVPDWRDPAALTAIVSDVLRALPGIGRPTGPPPSSIQVEFSWLDLPLLVDRLTRGVATDRWVTPRETAVREAIRAVLNRLGPIGTGTAAEILLRAAVLAEYPEWTDDPLAAVLVTQAASESVVADDGETSEFAGVLLLLRAVSDLNLPGFLARLGISGAIESILLDVACHLTGAEPDDPAVLAFAGRPAPTELWQDLETTHGSAIRRELEVTLRGLRLDAPDTDDLTETLALAMVAAWSRWLTSVPGMTPADLITHFVRRPGRLWWRPRELRIELEARLLDVALRGAGYDQPIESVAWLGGRRVTFRMVDA